MRGIEWVGGSRGAKVLEKQRVARGAMGEPKAPRWHDWCMGKVEGVQVVGVPGKAKSCSSGNSWEHEKWGARVLGGS